MFNHLIDIRILNLHQLTISMNENMKNYHYCYQKKLLFILIILQQIPLDVESMRHMETLVGKMRGKGVKVQHIVNVEMVNEELDMKTMCNTEHNKALK